MDTTSPSKKATRMNNQENRTIREKNRNSFLTMDPVKVTGIAKWPTPSTVKDVRSFLRFANFYCCFIPHYSDIA